MGATLKMLLADIDGGLDSYNAHPDGTPPPQWLPLVHKYVDALGYVTSMQLWHILRHGTPGVSSYDKFLTELDNCIVRGGIYAYSPKANKARISSPGGRQPQTSLIVLSNAKIDARTAAPGIKARLLEVDVYASLASYRYTDDYGAHSLKTGEPMVQPVMRTTQKAAVKWPGIGFRCEGLYPNPEFQYPLLVWGVHGKIPSNLADLLDGLDIDPLPDWPPGHPTWSALVVSSEPDDLAEIARLFAQGARERKASRGWFVPVSLFVRDNSWLGGQDALKTPFQGWALPNEDRRSVGSNMPSLPFDPKRFTSPVSVASAGN